MERHSQNANIINTIPACVIINYWFKDKLKH